jgi:NAD(P)-dependent dehydrogenase (short-subunit alcohol dehydrogenase family)
MNAQQEDPRTRGPQPPQPAQQQTVPGSEAEMTPRPDYGEESYRGSDRLRGKVAIITGGDSGIGRAIALAYAREGANVVLSYLSEEEDAAKTAQIVEEAGSEAMQIPGDIGDETHCRRIVTQTIERFGRLDILINNAAYQKSHESISEVTPEELEHTYRTNLFPMFYLTKAALEHMQPGSSIINTASIQAYQPSAALLPYATTKGAIVTFTKGLSEELIKKGIRVNSVAPGPVWTPLIPATTPPEKVENFGKDTPIGRVAQPAELAPIYVFLASNDSSYITGEVVGVTGGKPLG